MGTARKVFVHGTVQNVLAKTCVFRCILKLFYRRLKFFILFIQSEIYILKYQYDTKKCNCYCGPREGCGSTVIVVLGGVNQLLLWSSCYSVCWINNSWLIKTLRSNFLLNMTCNTDKAKWCLRCVIRVLVIQNYCDMMHADRR